MKKLVAELAEHLAITPRWHVEVAALLSQLGCIALPAETVEKLYYGRELEPAEREMAARVPEVTDQLLSSIPRLEPVRAMLQQVSRSPRRPGALEPAIERGAAILRIAIDFDQLDAQGNDIALVIDTLRGRGDRYAPDVLAALMAIKHTDGQRDEVRELPIASLQVGMILASDVHFTAGPLLVARGFEVTPSFIVRARNFRPGSVREPVRVIVRRALGTPL